MAEPHVPADYKEMDDEAARQFDERIRQNFTDVFPLVVDEINEHCGPLAGICIDIGSGTAMLTLELARRSDLELYALEKTPAIHRRGEINITAAGMEKRITAVNGDAHQLPFAENFADLIVSRGSYHYWDDKVAALREIIRVLKPGGRAFVGGGFGHGHRPEKLRRMVDLRDRSLGEGANHYLQPDGMRQNLEQAGIKDYKILFDETGLWTVFSK